MKPTNYTMDNLSKLVDRLDENERISFHITDGGITKISAPWLFIVSTALSFEGKEDFSFDQIAYDQLFGIEFGLTAEICDHLRHAIESVLHNMKAELTQIHCLRKEFNDIKWSWRVSPNFFERHMLHISALAREVMRAFNWYEEVLENPNFNEFELYEYHLLQRLESEVLLPIQNNLTSAAYDIINVSKYGKDRSKRIEASDINILYFLFDIFAHSITVARSDPEKFATALLYRTKFDNYLFDCLLERNDLHERIKNQIDCDHFAIDDMLKNLGASLLALILLRVYSDATDHHGHTFLHHLLYNRRNQAFIELFPHCQELWSITNYGCKLTPMMMFFHLNDGRCDLNVLFQCVSHNADFFSYLV